MEDNIQTILGVIISVFLLFIFPVYMAYEKKDDISYVLAMRYTQEFVDDVKNKGYITDEMLNSYKGKLFATGNSFDIELRHEHVRLDPITNLYSYDNTKKIYVLEETKTQEQIRQFEEDLIANAVKNSSPFFKTKYPTDTEKENYLAWYYPTHYAKTFLGKPSVSIVKVEDTYRYSKEIYTTEHIENVLRTEKSFAPNAMTEKFVCVEEGDPYIPSTTEPVEGCQYAYIMNEGDSFNVTIKNTNTTMATAIYNMVTSNTIDKATRLYVNYGGEILNVKWYGKVDYTKLKHDELNLYNLEENLLFDGDMLTFEGYASGAKNIGLTLESKGYMLEFEVKPFVPTELRQVGHPITNAELAYYNPAMGGGKNDLTISVGINGIAVIFRQQVIISYPMTINEFKHIKVLVQKGKDKTFFNRYEVVLYVDDIRIDKSEPAYGSIFDTMPKLSVIGKGFNNYGFNGYIRNIKVHN